MKLTSKKLKQLIREELEKVIKEADDWDDPADPRSWGQVNKEPDYWDDPADPRSWGQEVDVNLECWELQHILDKNDDGYGDADKAMKEKGCPKDQETAATKDPESSKVPPWRLEGFDTKEQWLKYGSPAGGPRMRQTQESKKRRNRK